MPAAGFVMVTSPMWLQNSLDQVQSVVDGGPVQQRDVLLVRLPHVVSRLHQLLAALQDSKPRTQTHKEGHTL